MKVFLSRWGKIELTEERKRHIVAFHPDITPYIRYFETTLQEPEQAIRSKHDPNVFICYHQLPRRKPFLAIVVRIKPSNNFILTAYLTNKIKPT